jgi:TRAP-type C4-dicarboxylate transport system permease small subunit
MAKKSGSSGGKSKAPPATNKTPATSKAAKPETPETAKSEFRKSDAAKPEPAEAGTPSREAGHGPGAGAAWAEPLVRLERGWTWIEVRLLLATVIALIAAMVFWIALKDMAVPLASGSKAGTAFRSLVGALGLAAVAHQGRKLAKVDDKVGAGIVVGAAVIGAALGPAWRAVGVDYFDRIQNWLQEGSSLTMFGGPRGVSTRLTVILAMIGASLAAAGGKHISIDALLRFVPPKARVVTFSLSTVATMAVCVASAWGFVDYLSIESFGANKDASRGEKLAHVQHHVSQDFFLWRKQLGLDIGALPRVLGGGTWDDESRMNGRQWNDFVESSGYRDYFTKEQVDAITSPPDDLDKPRIPMVVVPDGSARGLLVHTMNLAFPIGLLVVAARLLLRMFLVLSGHEKVEIEGELTQPPAPDDDDPPPDSPPSKGSKTVRASDAEGEVA